MPPARTQVSCPNCRQPVVVEIQQLFDLNEEPQAKELLLSGLVNMIQCPHCQYNGRLATAVVYHDPGKELLLTNVPAELGLPRNEQEKLIGGLITRVMNRLPQEQRKAYLLSPQTTLTYQGMIDKVLEADGITKEMIESQQKKLNLLQRLLTISDDSLAEIAQQEDSLLDAEFFTLLGRLIESSGASGDQNMAQSFAELQEKLLPLTSFGQQMQAQISEMEAAVQSLQEVGEGLTREKLLDIVIGAPNDNRVRALVSLARQGMDYSFFQILSDRIDQVDGDMRGELVALREQLLEHTREVDQQVEARLAQARQLLSAILQSHNIQEATLENLAAIDQFFLQVLNAELEAVSKAGDQAKAGKLQQVLGVLEQASSPPPEVGFIQDLLDQPDDSAREKLLGSRGDEVTPELIETLTAVMNQAQGGQDEALVEQLRAIHRQVVRFSMQAKMNG
jgi:hypothetical protein